MYPVFATRSYTCTRGHQRMRVPTHLRTHTRSRIGGTAAYNGPRRIDNPAGACPACSGAPPGPKKRRIPITTW